MPIIMIITIKMAITIMIIIITIKMQFIIQNNDYAWQPTCPEPLLLPGRCCKVCPGQHDSKSSSSYKYKCKYELNNEKFIPNHTPSAPIHQFVFLFFSRAIVFFCIFSLCVRVLLQLFHFVQRWSPQGATLFSKQRGGLFSPPSPTATPLLPFWLFSHAAPPPPGQSGIFLLYRALFFIQGPALSNSFKTFFAFKLARSQNGNNPLCGRDISYTFPLDKIGGFRAIRCPLNVSLMKLMSVKCLINVA